MKTFHLFCFSYKLGEWAKKFWTLGKKPRLKVFVFYLARWILWRESFSRSLLVLPCILTLRKKSGNMVIKVSEMMSKKHFFVHRIILRLKSYLLRNPFQFLFFWFWPSKKCGRCVEDFDGVIQRPFLRVQKKILRGAFQKTSSCFITFKIWNKSLGFSRKFFQRLSKVHPTRFQWQVDHFEKIFFWNFCCFTKSLFDFHRTVCEIISAELRKLTNDIPNV